MWYMSNSLICRQIYKSWHLDSTWGKGLEKVLESEIPFSFLSFFVHKSDPSETHFTKWWFIKFVSRKKVQKSEFKYSMYYISIDNIYYLEIFDAI